MRHSILVLAIALAAPAGAQDGPVPIPAPLPTRAVDVSRFPVDSAARDEAARRILFVAPGGAEAGPGTSERPFRSIRRALEAAASGPAARILVRGGTYGEGSSDDDFALRIVAGGTVVAAAGKEPVVVRPAASNVTGGLAIEASRVTWRGIALEGFASTGIAIGVEGRTLEDIVLSGAAVRMPAGGDGITVWPDHRDSGRAVISGLLLTGVRVEGADIGVQVGSGPARDVALVGVAIRNRSTPEGSSGADAFAIESGDNVLVNGGEMTGAEGDGIDLKATRCAVLAVHVHHVLRNGIKLWHDGDVVNALVHDCGADASIVLGSSGPGKPSRFRIAHSTVAFHGRRAGGSAYAMTVAYDSPLDPVELELANVVFHGNAGGIVLSKGTKATIRGCLLGPGPEGQVLEYGFDGSSSESIDAAMEPRALERVGRAEGNLPFRTDPGFARAGADDLPGFRPGPRSRLIGAGIETDPGVGFDLGARARPRRRAIGALEAR